MNSVVIVEAARTPIGSFQGALQQLTAVDLGAVAIRSCLGVLPFDRADVDEVVMGCVLTAGLGQAPARQVSLKAGIPSSVPATTVNKVCGSGMRALMIGAASIISGEADIVVAGGMESMTNAPHFIPKLRKGVRFGGGSFFDHMEIDGLRDAYDKIPMGVHAESLAQRYGFSREAQDAFAVSSFEKAIKAFEAGKLEREVTPIVLEIKGQEKEIIKDEGLDRFVPEKISSLKPAFKKDGTITAANASGIADGAAALLVMSEEKAQQLSLKPRARIVGTSSFAREPENFTLAPVGAVKKLLGKVGWAISDVNLFEVNEAFAVVPMAFSKDLDVPFDQINIHGGACAIGHPIGASGARVLVSLLCALESYQLKKGVATVCIGGGEANAVAIELID